MAVNTPDQSAVNATIATNQRDGWDKLEYGTDGQVRNPQVDAIVVGRSLPWWSETRFNTGQIVKADGLMTAEEVFEKLPLLASEHKLVDMYAGRKGGRVPNRHAVVRALDGAVVGDVGNAYRIVQPRQAFDWADNLVDSGEAKYETAGLLRGGSVAFLSMEIGHLEINVNGVPDTTDFYLMIRNSYDGSSPLIAVVTPVRTVCTNTDRMARLQAASMFTVRHSGSPDGKLAVAREALGIEFRYKASYVEVAQALANKRLVDSQIEEIFRTAIFPIPDGLSDGRVDNHPATRAFESYLTSDTLDGIRGTAWGAYNAITEFVDWGVEYKTRSHDVEDHRLDSITLGKGQERKDRALAALLKA